jgi:hypothetical protein
MMMKIIDDGFQFHAIRKKRNKSSRKSRVWEKIDFSVYFYSDISISYFSGLLLFWVNSE